MTTPRQPRLARSSTAHTRPRQLRSPGRRPITLTRRRVSPKVRSLEVGMTDAPVVADREAQVGGEAGEVGHEALDGRREALSVSGVEVLGPGPRRRAGWPPRHAPTDHGRSRRSPGTPRRWCDRRPRRAAATRRPSRCPAELGTIDGDGGPVVVLAGTSFGSGR